MTRLQTCIAAGGSGTPPERTVQARVVAQQSGPSFLESIAEGPDRALYVTDFHNRQLLRYVDDKGFSVHARLDVHPWGMVFDSDGTLYFGAAERGIVDKTSPPTQWVWRQRRGEAPQPFLKIEQARALNGMTLLAPGRILIADGRGGTVWLLDVAARSASPFVRDALLDVPPGFALPTPAANGLKIHAGHLYVSNTRAWPCCAFRSVPTCGPAPCRSSWNRCARTTSLSPSGNLYVTTHRREILRVTPEGRVSEVPGIGPELVGSTAMVWRSGEHSAYAINDGGFIGFHWYGGSRPRPRTWCGSTGWTERLCISGGP
ncbi:SMP-30/gluconolactonase/LRE family protein [Sphingobium herbicidovorans]|uniref:hypothetical protein n=1 Tax=Sphingobium herbicidovorans TaxID=76947 RepID=UPI0009DA4C3E|nr:hypothetical protein [Sphingobium herbicidovorans]